MLVMVCHLRSYSKISGVSMTFFAAFTEGEICFQGELKSYPYRGESGSAVN